VSATQRISTETPTFQNNRTELPVLSQHATPWRLAMYDDRSLIDDLLADPDQRHPVVTAIGTCCHALRPRLKAAWPSYAIAVINDGVREVTRFCVAWESTYGEPPTLTSGCLHSLLSPLFANRLSARRLTQNLISMMTDCGIFERQNGRRYATYRWLGEAPLPIPNEAGFVRESHSGLEICLKPAKTPLFSRSITDLETSSPWAGGSPIAQGAELDIPDDLLVGALPPQAVAVAFDLGENKKNSLQQPLTPQEEEKAVVANCHENLEGEEEALPRVTQDTTLEGFIAAWRATDNCLDDELLAMMFRMQKADLTPEGIARKARFEAEADEHRQKQEEIRQMQCRERTQAAQPANALGESLSHAQALSAQSVRQWCQDNAFAVVGQFDPRFVEQLSPSAHHLRLALDGLRNKAKQGTFDTPAKAFCQAVRQYQTGRWA
jgi:hypothetical protein